MFPLLPLVAGAGASAAGGGMLAGLGSALGGSLVTSAGSSLGGGLMDKMFNNSKKIPGIPMPSGTEQGNTALDYFNTAFPGTNAWERLGTSSPTGGVMQGSMAGESQRNIASAEQRIQKQQLYTQNAQKIMDYNLQSRLNAQNIAKDKYIADQQASLKNRELDLMSGRQESEIHRNKYGSIPSALKSLYDEHPEAVSALLGVSGGLGLAGKAVGAWSTYRKGKAAYNAARKIPVLREGFKRSKDPIYLNAGKNYYKNFQ